MKRTKIEEAGSIACKINMVSREIRAAATRLLAEHGVTPQQSELLHRLTLGQTSPSVIAKGMGVDASLLSRMIRTMEKHGWIERKVDDNNRRRAILSLTKEGERLAARVDPHAEIIQQALESKLSVKERTQLIATLTKVNDVLQQLGSHSAG